MLFSGDTLFPGGPGNTKFEAATSRRSSARSTIGCSPSSTPTRSCFPATATTRRSAPSARTCRSGWTEAGDRLAPARPARRLSGARRNAGAGRRLQQQPSRAPGRRPIRAACRSAFLPSHHPPNAASDSIVAGGTGLFALRPQLRRGEPPVLLSSFDNGHKWHKQVLPGPAGRGPALHQDRAGRRARRVRPVDRGARDRRPPERRSLAPRPTTAAPGRSPCSTDRPEPAEPVSAVRLGHRIVLLTDRPARCTRPGDHTDRRVDVRRRRAHLAARCPITVRRCVRRARVRQERLHPRPSSGDDRVQRRRREVGLDNDRRAPLASESHMRAPSRVGRCTEATHRHSSGHSIVDAPGSPLTLRRGPRVHDTHMRRSRWQLRREGDRWWLVADADLGSDAETRRALSQRRPRQDLDQDRASPLALRTRRGGVQSADGASAAGRPAPGHGGELRRWRRRTRDAYVSGDAGLTWSPSAPQGGSHGRACVFRVTRWSPHALVVGRAGGLASRPIVLRFEHATMTRPVRCRHG